MSRPAPKAPVRRAAADLDVEEALDFYLTESAVAATGFLDSLESAYEKIARQPAIGAPRYAHRLGIPGLRFWKCGRFPCLIFYVEQHDRIDLLRVLHERRDIPPSLADDDAGSPTLGVSEP